MRSESGGILKHDDITRLLRASRDGDAEALDQLLPLVYQELRKIADAYLRSQRPDHTLQPTALLHEAYIKLAGAEPQEWNGRTHFFATAAAIMRNILVDHARSRQAEKRGSGARPVPLDLVVDRAAEKPADLVALDDALRALAVHDERKARVLELRYFAGLSVEETAEAMGLSVATVGREARFAAAWLRRELLGEGH
ncbi:MAG TPA: sigma-70 family RNA polymerase sigma factor [Thermoanaerobaculia bacterium]|nr:sigma-70 family RNA polymerase sigma factor [Thermoanaerobaculia bacterium]